MAREILNPPKRRPAAALALSVLGLPPAMAYGALPLFDEDHLPVAALSVVLLVASLRLLWSREASALKVALWVASAGPVLALVAVLQAGRFIDQGRFEVARFAWAAMVHGVFGTAMVLVSRARILNLWYLSKAEREALES